jgi:manganese/zinc/iron transport system substrate-binding protein
MIEIRIWVFILIVVSLFSSCEQAEEKEGFVITATTSIIQDGLEDLMPADVEILSLMGPGIDPHLYKPTSADLGKLKNADIIVYNGLSLEGKMGEILKNLSRKKPTLAVSNFIDNKDLRKSSAFKGSYDPHIWFDVDLWQRGLTGLSDSIYLLQAWNSDLANTPSYSDTLKSLHEWVKSNIMKIPEEKRILVTAHDAFGYFGRAYGIEVVALQGISTLSEAGIKDIENLIDFILEKEIKSVFLESIISPKAIKAVIQGCRLKGYEVKLGGTLYSDAMGPEGTLEDNYPGMIRYNVNTIVNSIE